MELEYGVKIARPALDPAFDSVETEYAFVLLIHLQGEQREGIEIEVSEDGAELRISGGGGASTREHVLSRRVRLRREEEVGRFRKAFLIPEGVNKQGIEAEYDEDNEILLVYLPKLVAGQPAGSATIEEIKEKVEERGEEGMENPAREPEETHGGEEMPVLVEAEEEVPKEEVPAMEDEPQREEEVAFEGGGEEMQRASREPEPEAAKMPEPKPPREGPGTEIEIAPTPQQESVEAEVDVVPTRPPEHHEPEPKLEPMLPPASPGPQVEIDDTPTQEDQEPEIEVTPTQPPETPEPAVQIVGTPPLATPEPEVEINPTLPPEAIEATLTPPPETPEPEVQIVGTPPPATPEPEVEVVRTPPPEEQEPELEIVGTPPQEEYVEAELEVEPNPPPEPDEGEPEGSDREQEILVPGGRPEDAPGSPEPVAAPEEAPRTEIEEEGGGKEEEEEGGDEGEEAGAGTSGGRRRRRRRWRRPLPFRTPFMLVGSALFFSVVALAFYVLRARSKRRRH